MIHYAQVKSIDYYEQKLEEVQCRWVWLILQLYCHIINTFRVIASQSQVQSLQSRNYHLKDKLESLDKVVCVSSVVFVVVSECMQYDYQGATNFSISISIRPIPHFLMVSELALQIPSTDTAQYSYMLMVCDTAGMILLCNTCKTLIYFSNWYQYLYFQTAVLGI